MLENSHASIVKLSFNKTVKCGVINVEFLGRDLPLNSSAIIVKWKCLKSYSSKGMCRIDSQSKKLIHLNHLILETPCAFFFIFISYFIVLHNLTSYHQCFQLLTTKAFPFFGFSNLSFSCLFYNFKKENFVTTQSI